MCSTVGKVTACIPLWTLCVPDAELPIQLPANGLQKVAEYDQVFWYVTPMWVVLQPKRLALGWSNPAYWNHLGIETACGVSISPISNTDFQINK